MPPNKLEEIVDFFFRFYRLRYSGAQKKKSILILIAVGVGKEKRTKKMVHGDNLEKGQHALMQLLYFYGHHI